jgi:hypothetical protein
VKFDPATFLRRYAAMDRALVAVPRTPAWPATSPWWNREIRRFFLAGVRRWVIRAGRRGGKSSTLCRLAVAWALYGAWSVPPGDVAVVAVISIDRDEASKRLRTIRDILTDLGVGFEERGDELELTDRPVVFKVITCSIRGTVGFTCIFLLADEMARWESRDDKANPAASVMGTARPTMATQEHAIEVDVSSAWSVDDYHAQLVDAGDTAEQVVSQGCTWECNPTITERRTHELEPDPKTWAREYGNVPGGTISDALDAVDLSAAFERELLGKFVRSFVAIDASSLRNDGFTWLAGRETDQKELAVQEVGGWEGEELRHVSMATIVETISDKAKEFGTSTVYGDQREEAALRSLFSEHGINLVTFAWSEPSKDEAVMLLRRVMRDGTLSLCEHATLRRELTSMKARLMPSGRTSYATNGLDYASALITLAHAAVAGEVLTGDCGYTLTAEDDAALARIGDDYFTSHWSGSRGFG